MMFPAPCKAEFRVRCSWVCGRSNVVSSVSSGVRLVALGERRPRARCRPAGSSHWALARGCGPRARRCRRGGLRRGYRQESLGARGRSDRGCTRVDVSLTFCDSIASDIPLHTISRLLRTAVGVGELNEAAARAQVRTQFPSADPDDLRLLDDLLGNASPDVTPIHIDPDARRRRLTALVNGASLARTAPAVFIIEDAQWIDDVSEALLAEFLSVLPQTPTMVVITYRPDYRGALTRAADAQAVALAPLSNSATTALITELLGHDPPSMSRCPSPHAFGNPFFARRSSAT